MNTLYPPYEMSATHDGSIIVLPADQSPRIASVDGRGFAEALGFLRAFAHHYRGAVVSASALVARMCGKPQRELMDLLQAAIAGGTPSAEVRKAVCMVATQIANCAFGIDDAIPDYDEHGAFHPEFVPCALRAICPYNGYRANASRVSICNPAVDLGVQDREARLAAMLATDDTMSSIAVALGVTEAALRQRAQRLYKKLGVDGREHLRAMLHGRRVA